MSNDKYPSDSQIKEAEKAVEAFVHSSINEFIDSSMDQEFQAPETHDSKKLEFPEEVQQTLILIKPDAVRAKVVGSIINDFETMGFNVIEMKMEQKPLEFIEKHYEEHKGKSFFAANNEFVASGKLVALVLEGKDVISRVRAELGAVGKGGLRGTYGSTVTMNAIHASDTLETAKREIKHWFGDYVLHQ